MAPTVSSGNTTRPDVQFDSAISAAQSTELPCHLNTITVTLRTNAPLITKCALLSKPCTLNPEPQTLDPAPSTLNPQPSTLNPKP